MNIYGAGNTLTFVMGWELPVWKFSLVSLLFNKSKYYKLINYKKEIVHTLKV